MIIDERQYAVTKIQADRFREALEKFDEHGLARQGVDPILIAAQRTALACQLGELDAEMVRFRQLRSGDIGTLPLSDISDIGTKLIEARIVQGLSQKDLGERLDMEEHQIRRYEQEGYGTADLKRCAEVAEALNVDLRAYMEIRASTRMRPAST